MNNANPQANPSTLGQAQDRPSAGRTDMADSKPVLPGSLQTNRRLSQWLSIHTNGTVSVRSGKVELGQGIATALAQIVAQELDVAITRIRMLPANTTNSPNEGMTSGSLSVQDSGSVLRQVCAQVRQIYLQAASAQLKLPPEQLEVVDGSIQPRDPLDANGKNTSTSYWALADDALLRMDAGSLVAHKNIASYAFSDGAASRLDIPDKITGQPRFIHDMALPGMLHGRVLHPPSPSAVLEEVDLAVVQALPGVVAVVRDGSFLGVIADDEYLATLALKKLAALAQWQEEAALPNMRDLSAYLRAQPLETTLVGEKQGVSTPVGDQHIAVPFGLSSSKLLPSRRQAQGERVDVTTVRNFQASYSRPFLAHASIGPSCAVARFNPASLEVWTHSQGIYNLRADLALVFGLPANSITVQHVEGAGCYGHNGADDVACDAALLARAVPGRAVQVQWTRESELGNAPFGPAMVVELNAQVDADGHITDWQHTVWSNGHGMRPGRSSTPVLLAGTLLATPFDKQIAVNAPLAAGGGSERNAVPLYNFAQWRAVNHRVLTMPIRSSALRSLGAHCNVFASESMMDEIAHALDADPLEFRLRHLTDPRARTVLQAAADMAHWSQRSEGKSEGQGFGLACTRYKNTGAYCAVVAKVDAGKYLLVSKLWIAVDVGRVISADGVINQIEGGAIQTVSWVLKEAVQFDSTRIQSTAWESYPILRFSEVPQVEVQIIHHPDQPSLGAGEATHGPVAAAIANALFDALGVRVRDMPLTTEAITKAAMAAE
jgi:nicotinate dehydrogenase subunit B